MNVIMLLAVVMEGLWRCHMQANVREIRVVVVLASWTWWWYMAGLEVLYWWWE